MNLRHEHLRVFLLQARTDPHMERQEIDCFLERCDLHPHQLVSWNVARTSRVMDPFNDFDAFLIGGAGEYSAADNHDWMPTVMDLIRKAYEKRFPTFGSCWGHQVIARALGGNVRHDAEKAELGCFEVTLTEEGLQDQVFSSFPGRFLVNMGHHDRVIRLPDGAVEMAYSASQRYQAFRMADAPMYGTQFHSELNSARVHERLIAYRPWYLAEMPDEAAFQAIVDGLAETTEVDGLMREFLRQCVLAETR